MNREKEIFKVTLVGSAANVLLTVFKFIAGVVGNSAAMVADAVHSLSDLLTDAIVLCFVRISGKPEDCGHDYGHGKYETLATTLIGIALSAVALGIGYKAVTAFLFWLQGGTLAAPGMLALWAAVVSIIIKELVYHYTVHKGRNLNSQAVEANAWHHRSDALSSLGTLVGIGGAILLGKRVESEILAIVNSFPDVQDPHHLRTRRIGSRYAIELHIRMDGNTPLNIAHTRTYEIEQALRHRFGSDTHVTIHVEPTHKASE